MSFTLRFTPAAKEDLERLLAFLAETDLAMALRAYEAMEKAWVLLADFPWSCRKVDDTSPFLRELIIPFGHAGYVALFEIDEAGFVTVLAVRHQREEDYC